MFLNRVRSIARLSAFRLTLSLLTVFAVVLVLAWVSTFWLVQREMDRLADARLTAQAALIAEALEQGTGLPQPAFDQEFAVVTEGAMQGTLSFAIPDRRDGTYRYDQDRFDFRYLIQTTPNGEKIIVSENAERQDELLDTLTGVMQVSLFGMLIAGLLAGLWLALRGQRRLDLISNGLAQVAQGHLTTRIELSGRDDDLSVLAERINATTERLEHSMQQMRVQSSNIAHDLRTPLARLRAGLETDLINLTENDQPVDADSLGAALEQIDKIVGTFNALLRLSRIESGAGRDAFDAVELKGLVEHVAETFEPVVENADQRFRVEITDPAYIKGDRDLLVQLIANLIQNALRYGSEKQEIVLSVHGTVLSVIDQGPGIAFSEREKVLQPLYQIEGTRQNDGFGLGLSMVAAISELHDATLSLSDGKNGCGLKVTLRFPKLTNL